MVVVVVVANVVDPVVFLRFDWGLRSSSSIFDSALTFEEEAAAEEAEDDDEEEEVAPEEVTTVGPPE